MLLSANRIRVHDFFGIGKTIDLFAAAGFQGIAFNNDVEEYYTEAHGKDLYIAFSDYGIKCFPPFLQGKQNEKGDCYGF